MKRTLGSLLTAILGAVVAAAIPYRIVEESRLVSDWARQFLDSEAESGAGEEWIYVRSGDRFAYVTASDGAPGFAAVRTAVHSADNGAFINQPASAERWALQAATGALIDTIARAGLPLIRSGHLLQYDEPSATLAVAAIPPDRTPVTIQLDERAVLVELVDRFALVAYLSGEVRAYPLDDRGDGEPSWRMRPAGPAVYAMQALSPRRVAVVSGYPNARLSTFTLHDSGVVLDWSVELDVTLDRPLQLIAAGDRSIAALPDALFISDGQTHERIAVSGLRQVCALAEGRHAVWEGSDGVTFRATGKSAAVGFDVHFAAARIAGNGSDRVVLQAGGRIISVRWIDA